MNPVTNKIYVANYVSGNIVTVIDGATNTTTTVRRHGATPYAVAVNPVTNKIYVANYGEQQRDGDRRRHQQHDHRRERAQAPMRWR